MKKEIIGNATLYLGDSREVMAEVSGIDAIITDPVWPNAPEGMFNVDCTPAVLCEDVLAAAASASQDTLKRIAIILRYDSDPRFLLSVPRHMPYFRTCIMPYALPSRIGRSLGGMEMAYVFGKPVKSQKGRHIIPGMSKAIQPCKKELVGGHHPCPRPEQMMRWIVGWHSDEHEIVCDPFMGSGTTGVAATAMGRKFVGVEIEQKYFDLACRRIELAQKQINMF